MAVSHNFGPPEVRQELHPSTDFNWISQVDDTKWKNDLRSLLREEAVQHLDDLIFRRTTLWENPLRAIEVAPLISRLFDWDDCRRRAEIDRVEQKLAMAGM